MSNSINMGEAKIMNEAENGYLDTRAVADLLDVTMSTVHYWLREGDLKGDSGNCIRNQRKKISVKSFEEFLYERPKYYERVYGEPIVLEEAVEEIKMDSVGEDSEILSELFDKMEVIESIMKKNNDTIDKLKLENEELETKKKALEKVIDMF